MFWWIIAGMVVAGVLLIVLMIHTVAREQNRRIEEIIRWSEKEK